MDLMAGPGAGPIIHGAAVKCGEDDRHGSLQNGQDSKSIE